MKSYDLGSEKITRLVRHFAVPCVISMLVAALYNIVDQFFIGWSSAGAYGNAATNIVYPFTVLALGLALLVGDGCAAMFSLALGEKNREKADKCIGNGFSVLIVISVLLCGIGFLFKKQILGLFGANPAEKLCYDFAMEYFSVICAGLPFYMIGQGGERRNPGGRLSEICDGLHFGWSNCESDFGSCFYFCFRNGS